MMKSYDQSVEINHNPNWPYIPNRPYRILIIGGLGSKKTNVSWKLTLKRLGGQFASLLVVF